MIRNGGTGSAAPTSILGSVLLDARHPAITGRTGRGVGVAVIDSGVNPRNPHIGGIASAVAFAADATPLDDPLDRLGHGTAVIAAIQEKAPAAEVHVIKVFHDRLATTARALVHAIDHAVDRRLRLINLSLGTVQPEHAAALSAAIVRACTAGALVVAAREHDGVVCHPGSLDGVAGVLLDWRCPRAAVAIRPGEQGELVIAASGYPRPIPGVPPERNIKGISFAVANATGMLARVLEARPDLTSAGAIAALLGRCD